MSRVLHGHDRVRQSTRDRVQGVIDELGYVPDGAAQSLSRRRKEVIGLVGVERPVPESDVESASLLFADEIVRGVEATVRARGWSVLIAFVRAGEEAFGRLRTLSGKVDGLIIAEGIVPAPLIGQLAGRVPTVVLAGARDESGADVVAADNRAGTIALVRHLVEVHGATRLFLVAGPNEAPDARERRAAFEEVLAAHPGTTSVGSFEGVFSAASGEVAGREVLACLERGPVDAVVCGNDQMAIGVIRSLTAAAIHVPDDVAVVGFDDIYPGALWDPPLTTVRQPMRALGERASSRLFERIANPALPRMLEVLPTELVLRASCGCPRGFVRDERRAHRGGAEPKARPGR